MVGSRMPQGMPGMGYSGSPSSGLGGMGGKSMRYPIFAFVASPVVSFELLVPPPPLLVAVSKCVLTGQVRRL
jgi:hypothetical protein